MISKLQRKFVLSAVLAIFVVMTVIVGTIHIMNYRRIANNADQLLEILSENGGRFPMLPENPHQGGRRPDIISPETPFESRYFIVNVAQDKTVSKADTGKIAAVDEETAQDYAKQVLKKGKRSGFIQQYRFLVRDTEGGTQVIFLDCMRDLAGFRSSLINTMIVCVIGMVSVFVLIIFFSGVILRPVIESYKKQKQFITDAGHELKTPLTIIDTNVEILEMDIGKNKWTESIHGQVQRLSALTSDLIALSRMEEGAGIVMLDFSLSDAVEETVESIMPVIESQKKTISLDIEHGLSCCGDEKMIRRLILALLDNAVKYSGSRGYIRVELYRQPKKQKNCLKIYNTAADIAPGAHNELFDRFYRTDQSRNSRTGGHGIGLSVAKAITDAYKGKISAVSEDGKSLTITVII